ncbi:hypothetical protein MRB53_037758 [Persea americana]|nr:hypothetical protein MRB53_037758 [Persea americana]
MEFHQPQMHSHRLIPCVKSHNDQSIPSFIVVVERKRRCHPFSRLLRHSLQATKFCPCRQRHKSSMTIVDARIGIASCDLVCSDRSFLVLLSFTIPHHCPCRVEEDSSAVDAS